MMSTSRPGMMGSMRSFSKPSTRRQLVLPRLRQPRRLLQSSSSTSSSSTTSNPPKQSWMARMRYSWRKTPIKWTPLPIAGGVALLVVLNLWKQQDISGPDFRDGTYDHTKDNMPTVKGPWQVHVIGALPLRTISRIYGALNSYTLPVWFRVPGYKLYSWIFGVNLAEMDPEDLTQYSSLSEFFMRKLKPGVRPIADYQLVSPADGRVVNFGYIENRRVEQVKGVSYSLDQLLSGTGPNRTAAESITSNPTTAPADEQPPSTSTADNAVVDEHEFANLNGLSYTIDQLMGNEPHQNQDPEQTKDKPKKSGWKRLFTWRRSSSSPSPSNPADESIQPHRTPEHDASLPSTTAQENGQSHSLGEQISLATQTFDPTHPHWTLRGVPKEGNKMYFCVVYLAPGDYHRFHSPANWVVERRRHFAGELFSVSPYMTKLLSDLFVLNERVALLGRWRHGFFSMIPVGATNVGSIRINFDSDLRTNSPTKPKIPGEYAEATYAKSSTLLQGKPLRAGEECGGFFLGSTIVLVFEAPEDFVFSVRRGDKVKVGEALGDNKSKIANLIAQNKTKEMLGQ